MLVNARGLAKGWDRPLFQGLDLVVEPGERVGVIGPNGSGKSTLLRLLAGLDTPDAGEVARARGTVLVLVPQIETFPDGLTAIELVASAVPATVPDALTLATVVLGRAGFDEARQATPATTLSGGWQKRLSVARALASGGGPPDLLLLDEPTNHLDVAGLLWLEALILKPPRELRPRATVFVTHDRVFLETCATRIVEVDRAWPGGLLSVGRAGDEGAYSAFRRRRQEVLEAQARAEASLANVVREDDRWLARGPSARRTKARGRIDASAERRGTLDELAGRNAAARRGGAGVDFDATGRRTRRLLSARGVARSMGGRLLFRDLDLELRPGVCLGLMGPNGSGKTTLLRVLFGSLTPDAGEVVCADPAPRVVWLTQQREGIAGTLDLRTALCPDGDHVIFRDNPVHVAAWARRFLFRDEQLVQPVSRLSGGELARLHIARLMLLPGDVLVLDEPTNDLDIPTLEVLEDAVEGFGGAVVLVTHDRALLHRLADAVLVLGAADARPRLVAGVDQGLQVLSEVEVAREPAVAAPRAQPKAQPRPTGPSRRLTAYELRELEAIEATIEGAEAACVALAERLGDPVVFGDAARLSALVAELEAAQARVEQLYDRWRELESRKTATAPPGPG